MSLLATVAVFGGAGCGALLRWGVGSWLNPVWTTIPLGTLAANFVGGLLVGAASAWFEHHGGIPAEWRLLVFTGFLGGLTTFSTFSAEVVHLLMRQQYGWAAAAAFLHLAGSLALTGLGIVLVRGLLVRG